MATETKKFSSTEDAQAFVDKIQGDGLYQKGYVQWSSHDNTVTLETDRVIDGRAISAIAELKGGKNAD
jgi:hypothetical protein